MVRPFPVLASVAAALLVACLATAGRMSDLVAGRLGLAAVLATVAVHALGASGLAIGRLRIAGLASRLGLPGWVEVQAEKNFTRAAVLGTIGATASVLTIRLLPPPAGSGWPSGLLAANLAFQMGAFAGGYAALAAQARLARDLTAWPDGASNP